MITVTDYWAPWCGPCKTLMPTIEKLAEDYNVPDSEVQIKKVNVDEDSETASKFGIRSIPTLVFEKDGAEVERRSGILPYTKIKEIIENLKA
jgi:thioredoxin 1